MHSKKNKQKVKELREICLTLSDETRFVIKGDFHRTSLRYDPLRNDFL